MIVKYGHEKVIEKDFLLVFYNQSNEVHLSYCFYDQMIICILHLFFRSYIFTFLFCTTNFTMICYVLFKNITDQIIEH